MVSEQRDCVVSPAMSVNGTGVGKFLYIYLGTCLFTVLNSNIQLVFTAV